MNICIIGSGNIAHALVAFVGSKADVNLKILSSSDKDWQEITTTHENRVLKGKVELVTSNPEIISKSDLILFTTPAFARDSILRKIAPFIKDNTIIGAFPGVGGFDISVKKYITNKNINIFSAQRVPYIARIIKEGKSVRATPKESINIAVLKDAKEVQNLLENLLGMRVNLLDDFLEVNLSNSNPILHSARLYELFENKKMLDRKVLFYGEWSDRASEILLAMDSEFMQIIDKLKLKKVKSLMEHYEVKNIKEMTLKLSSINAFKGIYAPLIKTDGGYLPDTKSRYFTEDVEYGLKFIKDYANKLNIEIPTINRVYNHLKALMEDI